GPPTGPAAGSPRPPPPPPPRPAAPPPRPPGAPAAPTAAPASTAIRPAGTSSPQTAPPKERHVWWLPLSQSYAVPARRNYWPLSLTARSACSAATPPVRAARDRG